MPSPLNKTLKRQVAGIDGTLFNVELSAAGIMIRHPRSKAFGPVAWGRIYLMAAQMEVDATRAKRLRVSRGLLTTGNGRSF